MLNIFGETHVGCVRHQNEDSIYWQQLGEGEQYLAVVADGMGGYDGGAYASQLAVQYFSKGVQAYFEQPDHYKSITSCLHEAGNLANRVVRQHRFDMPQYQKMGTTLLAMLMVQNRCWVIHAGDSRCYRLTENRLEKVTRDHSLIQELLDQGSLSEDQAERAPYRNMLTRALGPSLDLEYSLVEHTLSSEQAWLLCSDGLYNAINDERIADILQSSDDVKTIANRLIEESLEQHARDNVSVIVIKPH